MNTKILVLCVIGSIVAFATAHGFNDYNGEYETEPESVEIGNNEISEEGIQPMGNFGNQQWTGQHWNSNPYNGFYYPAQPSNLNRNWYLPSGFNPHHHGNLNPWGPHYGGSMEASYNYADKYAYDYFRRNGFTIKSSLAFCNNRYMAHIIYSSRTLRTFCKTIINRYQNPEIPTFPVIPETSEQIN
uniref:Secreted protein n=1 Tax=Strongyloides papillosus TaxID=174720 RepID=A0A0N5C6T0_STREA